MCNLSCVGWYLKWKNSVSWRFSVCLYVMTPRERRHHQQYVLPFNLNVSVNVKWLLLIYPPQWLGLTFLVILSKKLLKSKIEISIIMFIDKGLWELKFNQSIYINSGIISWHIVFDNAVYKYNGIRDPKSKRVKWYVFSNNYHEFNSCRNRLPPTLN